MPKEYTLSYLPLFYDDLQQTVTYISEELKNPQAALLLLDEVERAVLERLPFAESFEPYPTIRKHAHPYYAIYVKNYVVYYVVLDHSVMEVRRFLYKGRDRRNLL